MSPGDGERRSSQPPDAEVDPHDLELFAEGDSVLDAIEPARPRRGLLRSGAIAGAAVLGTNLLNVAFQLRPRGFSRRRSTRCWSRCSRSCSSRTSRSSRCRRGSPGTSPASPRRAIAMRSGPSSSTACGRWRAGGRAWWSCFTRLDPAVIAFEVKRELPFLALAVAVIATLPLPISWGGLQGLERFPRWRPQLLYGC